MSIFFKCEPCFLVDNEAKTY